MKKYLITYSTVLTMLTTACAPQSNSRGGAHDSEKNNEVTGLSKLESLIESKNSNIPLAEALVSLLQEQNPDVVANLRRQIESGEFELSNDLSNSWAAAKNKIIVGYDTAAKTDQDFLQKTLNLNLTEVEKSNAFHHQIGIKVTGIVQSLALQNLLKVYDDQIKKDSSAVSADLVGRIAKERPELIDRIDKTKNTKERAAQIEQIVIYLKQVDYMFDKYEISDDGAEKLIIYTAVAGSLAGVLAQQESVKVIIQGVLEIKSGVDKAQRIVALTKTLKQSGEQLSANAQVMGSSVKNIYGKIKSLSDDLDKDDFSLSEHDKKNARMLLNDFLNGSAATEIPKEASEELKKSGFFEKKRELESDVSKFISSADGAAKSLDNIILSTSAITQALGVKLDPKVTKAMDTAMKISKGIQAANAVATAFSAGGFVGALGAFSGGPATMALAAFGGGMGGGGPDSAIMAELGAIKQSLSEIKAMQKEILENQKKMMIMIKDLALMIEEYHRAEMSVLFDIHDEVLNVKEGLSEIDEAQFRSCEAMTSFALNKVPNSIHDLTGSSLDLIKSTIRDVTISNKSLKQFINNGSTANFKTCQQQMSTVFMTKDMNKFKRAAWSEASEKNKPNGGEIVRDYYNPALKYFETTRIGKEARWQQLALHLPVLSIPTLIQKKSHYLRQDGNLSSFDDLRSLTATHKLEKFVSALLVLHPYLTIDHEVWNTSLNDVFKAGTTDEVKERTRQMLVNAFERVQIAIVQEAILSGEPLLPSLNEDWNTIVNERGKCQEVASEKFCFVRNNELMRKNLLTYVLVKRLGWGDDSAEAKLARRTEYERLLANPSKLAQFLMIPEEYLKIENGVIFLKLSNDNENLRVAFPDVETVVHAPIQYTEAMARMIRLEHKVADELAKVVSVSNNQLSKKDLAAALFIR